MTAQHLSAQLPLDDHLRERCRRDRYPAAIGNYDPACGEANQGSSDRIVAKAMAPYAGLPVTFAQRQRKMVVGLA